MYLELYNSLRHSYSNINIRCEVFYYFYSYEKDIARKIA